jgi:hypothetical protein
VTKIEIKLPRTKPFLAGVFSLNGAEPIKGWARLKKRLDQKMLAILRKCAQERAEDPTQVVLKPWQHRDLRRTARTLMAQVQIPREIAEHCLAHTQPRIERTYNRYKYLPEKCEAFEKLASEIERIVNPPEGNVVAFMQK